MNTKLVALLACATLGVACSGADTSPSASQPRSVAFSDAKLSLSVTKGADGKVSGVWTEEVARGARIRVTPTCLLMSGNQAWVGGVIAESELPRLKGMDAIVRVDATGGAGGTSYTVMGTGMGCGNAPPMPLIRAKASRISLR